MKVYLNGKFVNKNEAKISVFDHGLLYGDGAFEGIRSYNGLVFKLKEHVDRLYETLHTLMIKIPLTRKQMIKAIVDTLKENKLKDAYIRVVVTRGSCGVILGAATRFLRTQPGWDWRRSAYRRGSDTCVRAARIVGWPTPRTDSWMNRLPHWTITEKKKCCRF